MSQLGRAVSAILVSVFLPLLALATPNITSLSASSGEPGASITISGSGFTSTAGTITFNGQSASYTSWADGSIVAIVPNGASSGNIIVTVGGVQSNAVAFTVLAPAISGLSPNTGEPAAGFVIQGSNFGSSGTATMNGQSLSTWGWTDTSINASVPSGGSSGNVVVTSGGLQSNGVAFTVLAPVIGSLSPASGSPGTSVVIHGSNFGSTQGWAGSVTFSGQSAAVSSWTDSTIQVTVPVGASTGNVVVNTAGGLQSNGVSFTVAPIINSLSPASAEPGTSVTIAGENFTSTTGSVTFNGQTATVTSWSNLSIGVTVPNGASSGNVVVTAGSLSSNGAWFGVYRPAIASVSPTVGNPGDSIRISGNYFGGSAGTVSFNGQNASVSSWSDGSITVTVPANATTGNVTVSNGGLQSNGINFIVGPYISSANPGSGNSGTNVTLNGFNFGNSFGGVTFNGQGASGSSWTNTSIGVSAPANVSSGPIVVTTAGGQQSPSGPVFVVPTVNGIFGETDIGTVAAAGSTSVNGSAYTVSAYSGKLGGTADSLHYLYEPANGDFDMITRATVQTSSDFHLQYGITVRDSLLPGAVSFSCLGESVNAGAIAIRTTLNGSGTDSDFGLGPISPIWLRIRRYGNSFQCLYSSNGSSWNLMETASSHVVGMSTHTVVGLSVMSDNQAQAQVVFDNVSLSSNNTQPPSPWLQQDLGAVSAVGDATYNNGVFTVAANAASLTGAASDSGHFVYQAAAGDFDFKAHVGWVSNATVAGATAGLMVRQSLAAEDMAFSCLALGAGQAAMFYRGAPGLGNQVSAYGSTAVVGWVRMKRNGSLFTCYSSSDGVSWTEQIALELNLSSQVEIGLLDGSLNGTLNVATFDSVSLTGVPGLPGPWQQQDVGSVTAPGDGSLANNVFTVESNSYDISGTADNFHYVYQQASGDLNLIAQVSWQNYLDLPKAGVMVRQSLNPSDLQYSCLVLSSGAIYAVWRTSSGTADQLVTTNSSNLWVKVNRHGSVFTCYSSPDGNTWTQVSSATVNMSADVYAGLAQTSGSGRYALVNYSNVSLQANIATVSITYPIGGSTVYLSQPVVLTANATASPGATVTSVQYFEGSNLLGQATTPPYSLNIGAPAKGTHTYTAVVTDSTGLQATSFPVTATMANPQVTGVSPNHGKAGTLVKITGIGFGSSPAGVQMSFNGVSAFMTKFGDGEIDGIVPSGSGTGPMGLQWPDGVGADGLPSNFGPCDNGANCVVDVVASPAAVIADGQHSLSVTVNTAQPTKGVQLAQTLGLQCVPPETPLWEPGMPASGGCQSASATTSFGFFGSGFGPSATTSTTNIIGALPCSIFGCQDAGMSQLVTLVGNAQGNGSTDMGPGCPACGEPINLMNGNTYIQTRDYSLPGLGGGIAITRTWNSQWSSIGPLMQAGMFGNSWMATYEDRITNTTSGVNYWLDDGKVWRFTLSNGTYTLTSPVDAHATLSFNAGAELYTLTFVNGAQKIFGVNGYLQQVVDRNGNTTTVTHDTSNRITQVTDSANRTLTFSYGDANNPNQATAMQDAAGVIANYSYDSSSHLTNVTYADSSQINYAYDPNGLITSVTDALGKVLEAHTYDGQRRGLTSQLANGVEAVSVSYPQAGLSKTLDSGGNSSNYNYTQIGEKNFVGTVSGPGCASCSMRGFNQYTYDSNGNVLASFDSNGVPTLFTYDSNGNVTSRSTPVHNHLVTWQYTYNSFGELLTATDPLGNVTSNTYDANGNLLTVTTPAPDSNTSSSVTTFAYDSKGELTSITDPLNHVTTLVYYATGLPHTITDAQNNVTTFNYDQRGNRTDAYDALSNHTSFAYDPRNRLTMITNPDTSTVSFAYDTRGRRTSVTDGNGKVTQYAYDDADRLISVTDANNHVTQYAYDLESNLTSITDANNHQTSFSYDPQGHLTQTTFPSTLLEKYSYDNVGNLINKIDRKGQVINYEYDTLNRLLSKTYPDSTSVSYNYDDAGRLTNVQDPTGTYSFLYDNMGRLKQTTTAYSFLSGNPFTTVYGYDAASNRTGLTDPSNGQTTYTYDTLNRLTNILDFNSNNFGFGYDALSRRTQLTRPNGIATNYAYDSVSNLLSVLHQQGATTLDGASYTYDSATNRKSKTNLLNNANSNFNYDNIYQLTSVTGSNPESYTYDAVGNRLTSQSVSNYAYNSSNELTAAGAATYTYDNNGNTRTKTDSTGTATYNWDFKNRLTSVQLPNSTVVTFKYDPFGRRIQKSGASTTNYVYDGANVVEEVDQSGNLLARYSQGAGIDEPLSELRSGAISYYQQDGLGSVTSLSSTGGALGNTYTYDSFGNLTSSTGSTANAYQYTAREYDPETGLRYYRARYYDPQVGRFLSEDSIRVDGGNLNFYEYVDNGPILLADPSGLTTCVKTPLGLVCYDDHKPGTTNLTPASPGTSSCPSNSVPREYDSYRQCVGDHPFGEPQLTAPTKLNPYRAQRPGTDFGSKGPGMGPDVPPWSLDNSDLMVGVSKMKNCLRKFPLAVFDSRFNDVQASDIE